MSEPRDADMSAGSAEVGRTPGLVRPLLAIESSNPTAEAAAGCGAGVGVFVREAGEVRCLAREGFESGRRQDDALMPMLDAVCGAAGVSACELGGVAVSLGPGGYTACRIAATVAQCVGEAGRVACFGVPTALALAHAEVVAGSDDVDALVVLLAWKRADVWRQVFARGGHGVRVVDAGRLVGIERPLDGVEVGSGGQVGLIADGATIDRVRTAGNEAVGALDGVRVFAPRFDPASVAGVVFAGLVDAVDPARVQPVYPRDPEAVTKWEALARAKAKAEERRG